MIAAAGSYLGTLFKHDIYKSFANAICSTSYYYHFIIEVS
jgi:hypothetical protein